MTMIRISVLFILISSIAFGVLIAQDDSDPIPLACDRDELLETQAELNALLDDFADQMEADAEAALAQLYEVGQAYESLAIDCGYIPPDIGDRFVGNDIELVMRALETVNGDPLNGQLLYNNIEVVADGTETGCVGCHSEEETAPLTEGTWTRWDEIRSLEPEFADYTFEQYMVESILLPWDYLVPEYGEVMPNNFGSRLDFQDLADIIAYMEGQDQFLD